jgi:hypothetical protein
MNEILATLKQPNIPDMDIGSYCLTPTVCGFTRYCWQKKKIPDTSIFNLPKRNNREWELYHSGIIALDDPRLTNLNELQERAVTCFKTDTRYVNKEFILSSLSTWQFPLIFLDFETINPAMPRYDRCCPFKHVPFQFSIHIWESLDAQITYLGFLHDTPEDPRPTLIPALLKACREYGSIVAYFSKFEAQQIEALADYALNYRDSLLKLIDRLVDPLLIIRGAVYDNAFHGSFSLKNVAPALLGESQSYNGMMIANGSAAQRAFEELISPNTTEARKAILKNAMIEYCKKDTFVMLELVRWLYMQVQSK